MERYAIVCVRTATRGPVFFEDATADELALGILHLRDERAENLATERKLFALLARKQ